MVTGCGVFAGMIVAYVRLLPEWRANHDYVETRCVVIDKRLAESRSDDGVTWRPEFFVRYTAGGREFRVWAYDALGVYSNFRSTHQRTLAQFTVGQEYPVWYDPAQPEKAVLVRGYTWWLFLFLLIPVVIFLFGLVRGLRILRGPVSPATAAAGAATPAPPVHAWAPDPAACEVPGTLLRVGLRPLVSPAQIRGLAAALFAAGAAFVVSGLGWFPLVCSAPLTLGAGSLLLLASAGVLVVGLRARKTAVEISTHPVRPGEAFGVLLRQQGPLRLRRLRVSLVCEEKASYRQGTDTRTETRCVCRRNLLDRPDVVIERDMPLEWQGEAALPRGVMHSLKAAHNEVRWKLVVRGEPARLPAFNRDFPFVVVPPAGARPAAPGEDVP
jgi:hypothetical protein